MGLYDINSTATHRHPPLFPDLLPSTIGHLQALVSAICHFLYFLFLSSLYLSFIARYGPAIIVFYFLDIYWIFSFFLCYFFPFIER